ncbi:hypothetical protein OSTOST_19031, partial [Ostertagia ostertagi]
TPTFCTAPTYRTGSSSCSSSDAASSAALIAETLQQIDQLGSDLESYCVAADQQQQPQQHTAVPHRVHTEYAALRTTNGIDQSLPTTNGHASTAGSTTGTGSVMQNGIRIRAESATRPPPPARPKQHDHIGYTDGTLDCRSSNEHGSIMGSRQSLNSSGYYCPIGSNQDLRYTNVNPFTRPAPNYKI